MLILKGNKAFFEFHGIFVFFNMLII